MLKWLHGKWCAWRYKRNMQKLRGHLAWFGMPIDQLSDKDIELGMAKISAMYRNFGISSTEIIKSFGRLHLLGMAIKKKQKESER